jgi:hypothetical protein
MLALQWDAVDLDAGLITVSLNVEDTKAGGRRLGTLKSKRGFRTFQIEQGPVRLRAGKRNARCVSSPTSLTAPRLTCH